MKKVLFLFAALAYVMPIMMAQSADDIIRKYEESVGGVDAHAALHSSRSKGVAIQMGMEFPFTNVRARPNKQRTEVNVQGMKILDGFDGEVAWGQNPFAGASTPARKSQEETLDAAKQSFEDDLLNYKAKGHSASLEGREEVQGVSTHVIKLSKSDGDQVFYYIDPDDFVPIKVSFQETSGDAKGMKMEQMYSDYQEVSGVMMPMSITTLVNGQPLLTIQIREVETNIDLPANFFAFPE
jgi:outer membrane lipoprotein-sorting protein